MKLKIKIKSKFSESPTSEILKILENPIIYLSIMDKYEKFKEYFLKNQNENTKKI